MQHLQGLGSQVALWQYFCHCLLTPLSWLPCLTFSLSPGALQHPTFSRSPSFGSLQVCACRFSPVLDRCGHAYGVSSLSGSPSSLGWLFSFGFPRAGVRMLAAPVTHRVSPAGRNHALLQVQPALWANNPCLVQVAGGVHRHVGLGTLQVCAVAAPSVKGFSLGLAA